MTRYIEAIIITPDGKEEHIPMPIRMAQRISEADETARPARVHTTAGREILVKDIQIDTGDLRAKNS